MPDNCNRNQTKSKNEPKDQRKPRQGNIQKSDKKTDKKAETIVKTECKENKYDIVTRSSKVKNEPSDEENVINKDVSLNITEETDAKYKKKEIKSNWAKYEAPIETYEEYEELEDMGSDYEVSDNEKRQKKRKYFNYTQESMIAAIQDTRDGVSVSVAAKMHKVPKTSLLNKAAGLRPIDRKMGRDPYLDKEIEHRLAEWIKSITAAGFRITRKQILDSTRDMIEELKIENPFKENRPSKRWFHCFSRRHPGIGPLIGLAPVVSASDLESYMRLLKWFKTISNYISDNNCEEIFHEPYRVYNAMETLVYLNPKRNKMIIPRWLKANKEDEFVSVLLTGNAAGDLLPPMLTFQCTKEEANKSVCIPSNWTVQLSGTGCVTEDIFFDYITNTFHKHLHENNVKRPVILFLESRYETMMSYNICQFCADSGIILLALESKETRAIQPLETSVLRTLKLSWMDTHYAKQDSAVNINKSNFALFFDTTIDCITSETVVNGFYQCGLVPWNPNKILSQSSMEVTELQGKVPELEAGIQFIEKYVNIEKILQFKKIQDVSLIKQEDKSLYIFYKRVNDMLSDVQFMLQGCQPSMKHEVDLDENNEQNSPCSKRLAKRSLPALKRTNPKRMKSSSNTFKFSELQKKFNNIDNLEDCDTNIEYLEEYSDTDDDNDTFETTNKTEDIQEVVLAAANSDIKTENNKSNITCLICKFPINSDEESNQCRSCKNWSCFICCDGDKYPDFICYKCLRIKK